MHQEKLIEIRIAKTKPVFPSEVIKDLIEKARLLESYRRVYLVYTVQKSLDDGNPEIIMPTLLLEQIAKVEKSDINKMKEVMERFFNVEDYRTRALPIGDWWDIIETSGVKIRGVES